MEDVVEWTEEFDVPDELDVREPGDEAGEGRKLSGLVNVGVWEASGAARRLKPRPREAMVGTTTTGTSHDLAILGGSGGGDARGAGGGGCSGRGRGR